MINICAQKSNNKFINNLIECDTDSYKIVVSNIQQNIYKKHFTHKFDTYLLSYSSINNEILQFIQDFCSSVRFIIYHDLANTTEFPESCLHIVNHDSNQNYSNYFSLPKNIVNKHLYCDLKHTNKNNDIIFFLDNGPIPQNLEALLYPNTTKPIKLFNNSEIKHDLNIGTLNEIERRDLLLESRYYICINDYYKTEALLCGCSILDIDNLDESRPLYDPNDIESYTYYQTFLSEILA